MSGVNRPSRADAVRNRELLLAAAGAEFAEKGVDASVADIAKRAGVAKGTMFRHFASKEDLVAAIIGGQLSALVVDAQRLTSAPEPGAALLEFLYIVADMQQQRDLSFLQTLGEKDPSVRRLRGELHTELETLVERARSAGAIRSDINGTDVWVLLCAPIHAIGYLASPRSDLWRRYLSLIFDGLRPEGAHPLPGPPPDWP